MAAGPLDLARALSLSFSRSLSLSCCLLFSSVAGAASWRHSQVRSGWHGEASRAGGLCEPEILSADFSEELMSSTAAAASTTTAAAALLALAGALLFLRVRHKQAPV